MSLQGRWHQEWRLGRELADKGFIRFEGERVSVGGRLSDPVRGVLLFAWKLTGWLGFAGISLALLLTTIGLGWRTRSWVWASFVPTMGFFAALFGLWFYRYVGFRLLRPTFRAGVAWGKVARVASDGRQLEVELRTERGRVTGRFIPRKMDRWTRHSLQGIRDGRLPGGEGEVSTARMRPAIVDRAVMLAAIGACAFGAWKVEPTISTWLLSRGEPTSGPLAGIPPALTSTQVESQSRGFCGAGDPDAPRVVNHRDGDALGWNGPANPAGWRLAHLRWMAGSSQLELAGFTDATSGRMSGFFNDPDVIGLTLVLPAKHEEALGAVLASPDFESLRTAWCAGMVARLDITQVTPPADLPEVHARRSGRDLVVDVSNLREGDMLLPVRWRDRSGPDAFDLCEVPQQGAQVGLLRAFPERRYRRFFAGEGDLARVYLIPEEHADAAHRLAREGTLQRCLVADSLLYGGVADVRAVTTPGHASLLHDQAGAIVRREPLAPIGASSRDVIDSVSARYRQVLAETGASRLGIKDRQAINAGFLDAIDWMPLLDRVSFTASLARLEVLRQRLDGADPDGQMGERFLMRFAEAFLDRLPPAPAAWDARLDIGEAWMGIEPGTEWTLDGRKVRVPSQAVADTYNVIGRFVLMDVAHRLEDGLNGATDLPGRDLPSALWTRFRLEGHDINIDVSKSSSRKALEAWVRGDFEYLVDRLTKKAAEKIRDEEAAASAAASADWSIRTQWSDGAAVRMSHLSKNGQQFGWLAQFDQARVRLGYAVPAGGGVSRKSLARGRQLLLATSGSYVTQDQRTSGLSVTAGTVDNFLITNKMHGLVVLGGDGQLTMLDLKNGGSLPGEDRAIRPLSSLSDFHALLDWLRRTKASAFQTHLLAYDGRLTINAEKSSGQLRERRLLVQANYRSHPIVVVVDIPGTSKASLFEAATIVMAALQTPEANGGPGLEVDAIANLDVGSFDILDARDDQGELLRSGPRELSLAMNLVTVSL